MKQRETTKGRAGRIIARILLRTLLVIFTIILLVAGGLYMICDLIFNGPSPPPGMC